MTTQKNPNLVHHSVHLSFPFLGWRRYILDVSVDPDTSLVLTFNLRLERSAVPRLTDAV